MDYTIHVPSDVSVEIDSNGADAQIESISGDLDVSMFVPILQVVD